MNRCPVCDTSGPIPLYTIRGHVVLSCSRCGAWFLPQGLASGHAAYEGGYLGRAPAGAPDAGPGGAQHSGYYDYERERALHLLNFQDNLKILSRYSPGQRLLDMGCASGHFMLAAQQAGYTAEGVDVSAQGVAAAVSRGLKATAADVMTLDLGRRFDVITLWETIEHIPEPLPVLKHLREGLAPGGLLALGTGDTTSPLARALGSRWWYLTPPDHCVYYNPKAMAVLLARAGFELLGLHRIWSHRVSSRNVAMKLMRSLGAPPSRALGIAGALPDLPLPVLHGTTLVAVARPR